MLKNILKTNGAQELSKNELQTITGGHPTEVTNCGFHACPPGQCCSSAGGCAIDGSIQCL